MGVFKMGKGIWFLTGKGDSGAGQIGGVFGRQIGAFGE
jgi:hypothetical protein